MGTIVHVTEDLSSILRSLSQKRRQGVLEIYDGDVTIKIFINSSKIVGIENTAKSFYEEVKVLMQNGGFSPLITENVTNLDSLFSAYIKTSSNIKRANDIFRNICQKVFFDKLLSVKLKGKTHYNFNVQSTGGESPFLTPIPIGQFLLEHSSFETNLDEYNDFYSGRIIRKAEDVTEHALNDTQTKILENLNNCEEVSILEAKTLLPKGTFYETLLALHKNKLIIAESREKEKSKEESLTALKPEEVVKGFYDGNLRPISGKGVNAKLLASEWFPFLVAALIAFVFWGHWLIAL